METSTGCQKAFGRSVSMDRAAEMLQVSRRTVYNWIRDGRLHTIPTLGASRRILVESLEMAANHPKRRRRASVSVSMGVN